MLAFEFILYVADQQKSKSFYADLLQLTPVLDVPGMTAFELQQGLKLGLMPQDGIAKLLSAMPHPQQAQGVPRCELYMRVPNPQSYIDRGLQCGAKLLSAMQYRDWGDNVGYISDLDGHVIAFAETK